MPDGQTEDFVFLANSAPSRAGAEATQLLSSLASVGGSHSPINEAAYIWAFSDVARAIRAREWQCGQDHYLAHGRQERRLEDLRYLNAASSAFSPDLDDGTIPCSVDEIFVSQSGRCMVIGWVADLDVPLNGLALSGGGALLGSTLDFARCRRPDAEAAIGAPPGKLLGFWAVLKVDRAAALRERPFVLLRVGDKTYRFEVCPKFLTDSRVREIIFEYFAGAGYFGNRNIESFLQLEQGIGDSLIEYNVMMSERIMAGSFAAYYGSRSRRYSGSIIVCLYGRIEFLFLQSALFTLGSGWRDYEFIYVSNSPELAETLQKEAAIAHRVYGIDITLVLLPDNAGFGGANNVAASYARSDRLLVVNPDVFPRGQDWAALHTDLLKSLPASQTNIFGVPLFYDDGSLMHGGMYFELDDGWSVNQDGVERRRMVRVEHYGKGSPPNHRAYAQPREVPAVTGAFISIKRAWFEAIGGFSLNYVFGHYEDADICLKSAARGQKVWLHDVPFWHLEGKGSTRRLAHEGGSLLNRWHFTRTWAGVIATECADMEAIGLSPS